MRVHFVGDLTGDKRLYKEIIRVIEKNGWGVVTKHSIERGIDEVNKETPEESELYAKKMRNWMRKADVIMVEISTSGLGAGYEIAHAMELGKPVIALYHPDGKNTPHVLKALENEDKLQVISYNEETLGEVIEMALDYASESMDSRFNFFISPKHQNYLDWISKKKKVPRAVFLRRLIETDMEKNKEYSG